MCYSSTEFCQHGAAWTHTFKLSDTSDLYTLQDVADSVDRMPTEDYDSYVNAVAGGRATDG